jgi:hypothetical protein
LVLEKLKEALWFPCEFEGLILDEGPIWTQRRARNRAVVVFYAQTMGGSKGQSSVGEGVLVEVNEEALVGLEDEANAGDSL